MSVIVSVVAENTSRVIGTQDIAPEIIEKQIEAVYEDIGTDAVKIGMLSQSACMKAVARKLREYRPKNIVIDPVMVAKNGCPLMQPDSMDTLVQEILPLADLLTPNIPEAEKIASMTIHSAADMEHAARRIAGLGAKNVLVKGGHASGDALDILFDGKKFTCFSAERISTKNTHGTGCTYSSAIASNLALGFDLTEAIRKAKDYVTTAIRHALPIGNGCGPTNHFYELYRNGLQKEEL
jgi:hydroxymethylpyrimidine/phosphomethylpyrimidine kinase